MTNNNATQSPEQNPPAWQTSMVVTIFSAVCVFAVMLKLTRWIAG